MSNETTLETEVFNVLFELNIIGDLKTATEKVASFIEKREKALRKDYEEVLASHRGWVREIDKIMNGKGAAEQASLCDLVGQISSLQSDLASAEQTIKELQEKNKELVKALDGALKDRG